MGEIFFISSKVNPHSGPVSKKSKTQLAWDGSFQSKFNIHFFQGIWLRDSKILISGKNREKLCSAASSKILCHLSNFLGGSPLI